MMSPPEAVAHFSRAGHDMVRRAYGGFKQQAAGASLLPDCLYLSVRCRQDFWRTLTKRSSV
jgi:hypothetical protein